MLTFYLTCVPGQVLFNLNRTSVANSINRHKTRGVSCQFQFESGHG